MAIRIIRICDICTTEHKQISQESSTRITEGVESVEYPVNFICSNCILKTERLIKLEEKQDGCGIACVRCIIYLLEKGDIIGAKNIYQHDGDKIISHPEIQQWCYDYFGCRLHLEQDCKKQVCIDMKIYHDRDLKKME